MPDLTRPLARVSALVAVFLVTVMLAWGKEFLMPLALAILGTFLLTPLVVAMERRRFPRVAAVILAVLLNSALLIALHLPAVHDRGMQLGTVPLWLGLLVLAVGIAYWSAILVAVRVVTELQRASA